MIFGLCVVTRRVIELQEKLAKQEADSLRAEIARLNAYILKCENLIDHERERIEAERVRADLLGDSLLAQNGLPVVSQTGRREEEATEAERKDANDMYMAQMAELSQETIGTMYDELGVELPPDLAAAAKELMKVN